MQRLKTIIVILATSLLLSLAANPAAGEIRFDRIGPREGLPSSSIYAVIRDRRGFMWLGTSEGLIRYDGYDFMQFQHDPDDPSSISGDGVYALYEDEDGYIWIGTDNAGLNKFDPETQTFKLYRNDPLDPSGLSDDTNISIIPAASGGLWISSRKGLHLFDPQKETFTHFKHDPNNPASLSGDSIFTLYEDRQGILWVGTWTEGLNRYDPASGSFTRYQHAADDPDGLSSNMISAIFEDSAGDFWVGVSRGGLHKLDRTTGKFKRYIHDPDDPHTIGGPWVLGVVEDGAGNVWVGTNGGGLNKYDREHDRFIRYRHNANDPYSVGSDKIWTIYYDREDLLWVGTLDAGLSKADLSPKSFHHIRRRPGEADSLIDDNVTALFEDRDGMVWIGTRNGLSGYDPESGRCTHFKHDKNDPDSLPEDNIFSIFEDRDGDFWIGLYSKGIARLDRSTGKVVQVLSDPSAAHDASDPHKPIWDSVSVIHQDRTGAIWFGTWGYGADRYDKKTGLFRHFTADPGNPRSLGENTINDVYEDRYGALWFATYRKGLSLFHPETQDFTVYNHDPEDPGSLSSPLAWCIFEDSSGRFWVGTDNGLNLFNRADETFTSYRSKHGAPGNKIFGVLEDDDGFLWLSTSQGLSRFDPENETFTNYDRADGLPNDQFNKFAFLKTVDGRLYFGSGAGVTVFDPREIKSNPFVPPVVLTSFYLFNKPAPIGPGEILEKAIDYVDGLTLRYKENVVSFEFAALSFTAPEKNRYSYMLEGFEKNWNEVDGARRTAAYTSLPGGEYVLRVRGSNNDQIWNNEGVSIRVTVLPPWWGTWWFRSAAAALLVFVLYGLYLQRMRTVRKYNRELERKVTIRTADLAETTRRLQTLLSNLPGMAYRCLADEKRTMEFVSSGVDAVCGYAAPDLTLNGRIALGDLILKEDRRRVAEVLQDAIQNKKPYEAAYRIKDAQGNLRWMWEQGVGVFGRDDDLQALEGIVMDISMLKHSEAEREKLINELKTALAEVKTLQGFIPICANCKKVRDDKGYWSQVEDYISKHSEAVFSHGICPDCIRDMYPEMADDILGKLKKTE